jgi:hypothetical protein
MSAYMGTMPWLMLWLGIPWIGSGITLLGNPNVLYSRRVLGWSVACFLALSAGLWWINPALFMTDMIVGFSKYDTTRTSLFTGMMFGAIVFLFTWPDGKTAKGLAILGSGLALMVGVRFGVPKMIYTELQHFLDPLYVHFLNPISFDFIMILIGITGAILWVLSIPYLTKNNTGAFDQAPLFGKFMVFLRWCVVFLPFIILKTFFIEYCPTYNGNVMTEMSKVMVFFTLYAMIALLFIRLQSWRIPGFWRSVGMVLLTPIMYFVNARYTYRPPLTSDKTALCDNASPEQIAFWNPWAIMNRGMIQLFFFNTVSWLPLLQTTLSRKLLPDSLVVTELDMLFYTKIGLSLILALHAYALFQPRCVPYRFLLWCSMIGLFLLSFALHMFYSFLLNIEPMSVLDLVFLVSAFLRFPFMITVILQPMVRAYRYRALLSTDETNLSATPALSRFWVLFLLGTSLSAGLYPLFLLITNVYDVQ